MLTPVERVLILKGADLLREVGPRHLLRLAEVTREVQIRAGDTIYREEDPADALYMVVEGRVRLSTGGRTTSEVGPGEAFGTWSLVDDSGRGQRADCTGEGLVLALNRDEFYDVAAGDFTLLKEIVRALAKRLRALVVERPEEARVEGEGVEKPETMAATEAAAAEASTATGAAPHPTAGASLTAAALGQPSPETNGATAPSTPQMAPGEVSPIGQPAPPKPSRP